MKAVFSFLLILLSIAFLYFGVAALIAGDAICIILGVIGIALLLIRRIIRKPKQKEAAIRVQQTETQLKEKPCEMNPAEDQLHEKSFDQNRSADQQQPAPETDRPRIMDSMAFLKNHAGHYVAFDLETTGLSPQNDAIIEIGAVKVQDGLIVDSFSTFVNPGRHIPEAATAINHITDDMVRHAPRIIDSLHDFQAFVGSLPCVAHNCSFDSGFLSAAGLKPLPAFADTLSMARRLFQSLPDKKLGTVCSAIGYEIGQAHRALDDAKAVHAIVQACAARAAAMEEGECALARHNKLSIAINQSYAVARESSDPSPLQMDAVLSMCREDFVLVSSVRSYCSMLGYPDPVFDSFRRAAIILTKRKDYDAAIQVCEQAVSLDIPDSDTEGGFPARIARLQRMKNQRDERQAAQLARDQARAEKEAKKQREAQEKEPPESNKRPVRQYTSDGASLIREHESVAEASRESGVSPKGIRDAAKGKQKTAGGFIWRYADE